MSEGKPMAGVLVILIVIIVVFVVLPAALGFKPSPAVVMVGGALVVPVLIVILVAWLYVKYKS